MVMYCVFKSRYTCKKLSLSIAFSQSRLFCSFWYGKFVYLNLLRCYDEFLVQWLCLFVWNMLFIWRVFHQDKTGRREMDAAKCQTVFLSEYVLSVFTNAAKLDTVAYLWGKLLGKMWFLPYFGLFPHQINLWFAHMNS